MPTASELSQTAKRLYGSQGGLSARLQTLRPYICPFEELLPHVPAGSSVLDVGCGAGLFLVLLGSRGVIERGLGFDVSQPAIDLARRIARELAGRVDLTFLAVDAGAAWPDGAYDVVSMIDVLHHVEPDQQLDVLSLAASRTNRGGILLYKDMALRPRWRAWCNQAHDLVMAREWIHHVPFERVRQHLSTLGMTPVAQGTATRYWYAHEWAVFRNTPRPGEAAHR
jgi:2-polyprenyl-3-methyl-5-hydroxy-6-metoxy-1,4-benzoquinol methylase